MRFGFYLRALLMALLIPLSLVSIPGCGGSTSGTGGVTVRGQIIDTSGTPLANTTIVALQNGDTTSTDENGQFQLQTDAATKLDFQIEQPNRTIQSSIDNIPANATELVVRFTVDQEKGEAKGDTISVKQKADGKSSSSSKGSHSSSHPSPTPPGSASSKEGSQSSATSEESSSEQSQSSSSVSSESESSSSSSSNENQNDTEKKVIGQIRAISGNTVTVETTTFTTTAKTEYKSRKGNSSTLSGFSVGESVKAEGKVRNGILELDKLESSND